ncbi:hypothetical protein P9112_002329 [Eukaryota sp. TZLM1-RC]
MIDVIAEVVIRCQEISIVGLEFICGYYLHLFHLHPNDILPKIKKELFRDGFLVVKSQSEEEIYLSPKTKTALPDPRCAIAVILFPPVQRHVVENNFIFNLDFKNAFNSVKRKAIFEVIKSDFPELTSSFYQFYGKESDSVFNSFGVKSSSGVKQGDPLGSLLFCLAIHTTLDIIEQKYPSIKIVAYINDITLIGSFDLLELVAQEIADSYKNIGLYLNASKCLLIGSSAQDLVINDSIVPFTNYSSDAFKFLGCWLGNVPQIQNELQVILEKMKIELDSISSFDLDNMLNFSCLKFALLGE